MSGSTAGPADKCRHILHQAQHRDFHLYRIFIIQSQHSSLSLRVLIGCFYTGLPAGYQTCYWTLADKFFYSIKSTGMYIVHISNILHYIVQFTIFKIYSTFSFRGAYLDFGNIRGLIRI